MKKKYLFILLVLVILISGCNSTTKTKNNSNGAVDGNVLLSCSQTEKESFNGKITDEYYKDKEVITINLENNEQAKEAEKRFKKLYKKSTIERNGNDVIITTKGSYTVEHLKKIKEEKEAEGLYTCK